MEIIIKAIDQVTPVMNTIKGNTGGVTSFMEANWKKVGVATAGAAAAIEGLARANAPLIETTRRVSDYIGITEGEMKKLVVATSNATFPLKDVLGLMELGTKQGLESADALKEYAEFWDMVSDATGESSTVLAEAAVSLKALGISAGEEGEALSAFGFIQKNTTMEIGEFINSIGRLAPEMREMGMGINDAATIMGILQQEFGMTSRVAIQEFRTAVNSSEGDMNKLKESLGITSEMFDTYSQKVSESSTVIEENAKRNNELFTPLQKIQHLFSELKYSASGYIESLAQFAPILIAIGPAMKIVGDAGKLMSKGLGQIPSMLSGIIAGFKTLGGLLIANPWVIAIMAIVTAVILLYENWEKVVNFISNSLDWLAEKFSILVKPIDWIKEKLGLVKDEAKETEEAVEKVGDATGKTAGKFDDSSEAMENSEKIARLLEEANYDLGDSYDDAGEGAENFTDKNYNLIDSALGLIKVYDNLGALQADVSAQFEEYVEQMEKEREEYEKQKAENEQYFEDKKKQKIDTNKPIYKIIDSNGNVIGVTNMPQDYAGQNVTLKKMHTGGIYRAPISGGEGLVWLKDRETVRTPQQEKALGNNITITVSPGAVQFTGTQITEDTVRKARNILFDNMIEEMRRRGLNFA